MIPLLIEPSTLSFELATNKEDFIDTKAKMAKLKEFIKDLVILFNELERNRLAIALTKEMLRVYGESVPCEVYQNSALSRLARETFGSKLRSLSKIVHKYGSHELEVSFDSSTINNETELNNQEIYYLWSDLAGLTFFYRLPEVIVKSKRASLFDKSYTKLIEVHKGDVVTLEVKEDIEQVIQIPCISLWRFFSSVKQFVDSENVVCSGTGTHSSMWGGAIRSLRDVPAFERELLEKLVSTGLVRSITFLAFGKRLSAVSSPKLIVNSVETTANSDIMMCTLRGRGAKQNCQDLRIELCKNSIAIADYCCNEITLENLETLMLIPAAIAKESTLKF